MEGGYVDRQGHTTNPVTGIVNVATHTLPSELTSSSTTGSRIELVPTPLETRVVPHVQQPCAPAQPSASCKRKRRGLSTSEPATLEPMLENFRCPVCLEYPELDECVLNRSCGHLFCQDCLSKVSRSDYKKCWCGAEVNWRDRYREIPGVVRQCYDSAVMHAAAAAPCIKLLVLNGIVNGCVRPMPSLPARVMDDNQLFRQRYSDAIEKEILSFGLVPSLWQSMNVRRLSQTRGPSVCTR